MDLKLTQKVITITALVVFAVSLAVIGYLSFRSPNGLLARAIGILPIEVSLLNQKDSIKVDYLEAVTFSEPTIIKSKAYVIVSNSISLIVDQHKINNLNGVTYFHVIENIQTVFGTENITLEAGEYIINSNPVSIHVLKGSAANNRTTAKVNEILVKEVDRFTVRQLDKTVYASNVSFVKLLDLLRNQNLLPEELRDLTANQNFEPVAEVEEESSFENCSELSLENAIICLGNNLRVENKLNTLQTNNVLINLSTSHAQWMNNNQSLSTVESNGLSYKERCANAGVECYAEMNIRISAPKTATNIFDKISNNPTYRNNILNKDISQIGISIDGEYLSILIQ